MRSLELQTRPKREGQKSPVLVNQLQRILKPFGYKYSRRNREFTHYENLGFSMRLLDFSYWSCQVVLNQKMMEDWRCRPKFKAHPCGNYFKVEFRATNVIEMLNKLDKFMMIPHPLYMEIKQIIMDG